ncbi:GNAT family N-acetyltransferase [Xenorhabdus sp. PB61.4]|uniref:GNAT family N-acetyltransferase n=1 Tax=Xenorhabdus TaxID=626 RepID=UPI001E546225|nr:GNAT family N-acetyltransferase [Xenorhabdus sp. PB61.4]MCC8365543.1 GNAT family N-acetyltransferase [Xenorhabdus sp. PB61.4]
MNQDIVLPDFDITDSDEDDPHARERVSELLDQWNIRQTGEQGNQPLDIYIRDSDGEVIGGLVGRTSLGMLFINYLYLPDELRSQRLGSVLLRKAEEKARQRGCHAVTLYTMSIQAPEFYLKHGYTVFGEVACKPAGNARIFMYKLL